MRADARYLALTTDEQAVWDRKLIQRVNDELAAVEAATEATFPGDL